MTNKDLLNFFVALPLEQQYEFICDVLGEDYVILNPSKQVTFIVIHYPFSNDMVQLYYSEGSDALELMYRDKQTFTSEQTSQLIRAFRRKIIIASLEP